MHLSRSSLFLIALFVGIALGYMPATWYFRSDGNVVWNDAWTIDTSQTTLRGVISGVDPISKTLTLVAVSPYSPNESAPLSVTFDDTTLFRFIPAVPGLVHAFLPTSVWEEVDAESMVAGTPVTVRVSRDPGPLHAFWISSRAPLD